MKKTDLVFMIKELLEYILIILLSPVIIIVSGIMVLVSVFKGINNKYDKLWEESYKYDVNQKDWN